MDNGQDNFEILYDSGAYAYVVPRMMMEDCLASGQLAEKHRSTAGKQIQKWDEKTSVVEVYNCLLYTSPSPRDATLSRMPSSA